MSSVQNVRRKWLQWPTWGLGDADFCLPTGGCILLSITLVNVKIIFHFHCDHVSSENANVQDKFLLLFTTHSKFQQVSRVCGGRWRRNFPFFLCFPLLYNCSQRLLSLLNFNSPCIFVHCLLRRRVWCPASPDHQAFKCALDHFMFFWINSKLLDPYIFFG